MPCGQQPSYVFRDNDGIYGDEVSRFLVGTGIAEVKTAHRCPWQNPFVERYGGTLRRELLDHVMVLNEEHLKRLLKEFIEKYYHRARQLPDNPFLSWRIRGSERPGAVKGAPV